MAKASPKTEGAVLTEDVGVIDADATAAANAADAQRTVRARVLAFCALGAPNDVVEVEADQVLTLGDVIDTDPAAVAYAESQGR